MQNKSEPKRSVMVIPYQTHWPAVFATEQASILAALGTTALALHHIGSTAVPGLAAKPIIDLLLEVTDLSEFDTKAAALASLGYIAKGENGISGRRYFYRNTAPGSNQRSHHLHVFVRGAPQVGQHLTLRDYLRQNPGAAAEYSALKQRLARQFPSDTHSYQAGKDHFVTQLLQQALQATDPANGYETHAAEFRHWREQSSIGVATVLQWAQGLPCWTLAVAAACR